VSAQATTRITYGNLSRPSRDGLLGLPMGATLACVPFVVVVVLMMARGWILPALLTVVVGGLMVFGLVGFKRQGRSLYARWFLRTAHAVKVRQGNHRYLSGPAGSVPDGTFSLPGILAPSKLSQHTDSFNQPFGMIHVPSTRHYTVVFEAYPDGADLVDQPRIDAQVAYWGAWLAQLGKDSGVVGASVTVETAPDSGVRLNQMVNSNLSPTASPFAEAVVRQLSSELAAASPVITTRIAVTFSGKMRDGSGKDRGREQMAAEIGNRLPALLSGLRETGAGTAVRPCTAQDIVDFTRTAYDPTVATDIEQARAENGTGLSWNQAGPVFAEDHLDKYFHDRAVSKTWQMWAAPRSMFYSETLKPVLTPVAGVLRKRATILYRPVPAGKAADAIQAELNNARWTSSQKQRPTAQQTARMKYAAKAEQEEAQGAGLVRFGMLVTLTCASAEELPRWDHDLPSLGAQAHLSLREALGNQAVAFQAALPLGVVLPDHTIVSSEIREWL
jgi:hypothetical protein